MATFLGAFESFLTQRTDNSPTEAVEGKSRFNKITVINLILFFKLQSPTTDKEITYNLTNLHQTPSFHKETQTKSP